MTTILLSWVAGEIIIKLKSSDPEAFTSLIESLKDYISPHERRYDPSKRQWLINSAAFDDISLWTEYAQQTFAARVEWSVLNKKEQRTHGSSKRAYKPHTPVKADFYATLHLQPTAPPELIRAAYKCLAMKHHPDHGGSTEVMQKLNQAYAVLEARLPN